MTKKSKRARMEQEKKRSESSFFGDEHWIERWIGVITAPPLRDAHKRLFQLFSGPEPVQGVASRPPSLDEERLFMQFVAYLQIQVTPQVMEGLDSLLIAIFTYARMNHVDLDPLFAIWIETELYGPAHDLACPGEVDTDHIASCLFLARMFALELAYFDYGWINLRQGLGLRLGDEWVSPSTLIGSCAQLLGGGHRIRKWCAGVGLAGKPGWLEGWEEGPSGRQDFYEILSAVDKQYERVEDEWAKAVLLVCSPFSSSGTVLISGQATKEHFEYGHRDLTSGEVYHIIFERTRPGVFATPGDQPQWGVDEDDAEQLPDEAVGQ